MIDLAKVYQASYRYTYEKVRYCDADTVMSAMVQYEAQITIARIEEPDSEVTFHGSYGTFSFRGNGREGLDAAIRGLEAALDACRYRMIEIEGREWKKRRQS